MGFEAYINEGYMLDIYERFDKDSNSDYYLVYEDFRDLEDGRCKYCILFNSQDFTTKTKKKFMKVI